MTIYLPEVRKISHDFMSLPVFNPNVFSEDEDDLPGSQVPFHCKSSNLLHVFIVIDRALL